MAILRHNPRLSALPCESMRGCTFAENFVTVDRVEDGGGSFAGTYSVDHGFTGTDGSCQWSTTDVPAQGASDYVSIVVRFSTSSASDSSGDYLISRSLFIKEGVTPDNGWGIWVDDEGVKASHANSSKIATPCEVDLTYADGNTHTVTYIIDMASGTHSLYVDSLAVNTQTTTINETIAASRVLYVLGSDGSGRLAGTVYKARIFDQLLTEEEHDLYHADTLTSFLDEPLASWRCDSISDDTDSNTIHDRTVNHNDLYKGDRSTASTFPTFDVDKYLFDKVDDYVSNWVTLPTAYTIGYVTSTPQDGRPVSALENGTTTKTSLETGGDFWGYLHNVVMVNKQLTTIEQYHLEYSQMYWQWYNRMWGMYTRQQVEDNLILCVMMDRSRGVYTDISENNTPGLATGVSRDGLNGCSFTGTDNITYPHNSGQNLTEGTIVVFFKTTGSYPDGTVIHKGNNWGLDLTSGGNATFKCASDSQYMGIVDWTNAEHIAVTFKDGEKAQFYYDGKYLGDGLSNCDMDEAETADITIGNNNALGDPIDTSLCQVAVFNTILTEAEIKALYESAKYIRSTDMETGTRAEVDQTFTAVAVDEDVDPGDAFQLIEVKVSFNTAPTTSEDITIASIDPSSNSWTEHTFDPSTSSDTTHVFRFDKRFTDNTTIAIDYTNTDGRTIKVKTVYQLDQSV